MFRNHYNQYNFYDILEISPGASVPVIEAAYKALVKKFHPDLNKGISDSKIKMLNLAKEVLLDEQKRREYDSANKIQFRPERNFSPGFDDINILKKTNDYLKKENEELKRRILEKSSENEDNVYVMCTHCGTKNRLPNMSFLNMQNIRCGICKTPFGTGNRDFEKEKDHKEKANNLKKTADIEWRRISNNIAKIEYSKLEALLNKYQEVQKIYPRVYGIKTKLKILKDEMMIRNSNISAMRKIIDECAEMLVNFSSKGILGFFKNEGVIVQVKEKITREAALYPKIIDEKLVYICRECGVRNAIKVEMFLNNSENVLCGSCHCNLFK